MRGPRSNIRRKPLIRRHSPSRDGRLLTPYGATFSPWEKELAPFCPFSTTNCDIAYWGPSV
jgi:hypothetical protein